MVNDLHNLHAKAGKVDDRLELRIKNIESYVELVAKHTGIPFKNVIVKNKVA
jgi:hypothetical protein